MFGEVTQATLATRLIEAVADAKDTTPLDLTPPLNDVLDPDALTTLVASGNHNLRVTVEYAGVQVTIAGTGEIMSVTQVGLKTVTVDADEESSGVASN